MKKMCEAETVYLDLANYEPDFDETVSEIDAWYDRHTRDYCIQLKNKEGYQIGDAYRAGTKAGKESLVALLKEEYGL